MSDQHYRINPDRTIPWNNLPTLPIDSSLYRDLDVFEGLGKAKAALGKLQGREAGFSWNQGFHEFSLLLALFQRPPWFKYLFG